MPIFEYRGLDQNGRAVRGRIDGDNAKIAAGSVILADVPDNAFMLGNPARVIGRNDPLEAA